MGDKSIQIKILKMAPEDVGWGSVSLQSDLEHFFTTGILACEQLHIVFSPPTHSPLKSLQFARF